MDSPYARIRGKNLEFLMNKRKVVIGRNSKLGDVDLNMGSTRFISRRHLEIIWDDTFYFLCRGKNGIFVDDIFQRRENKRLQLPDSCIIRFPSTAIKFTFTSLLSGPPPPVHPMHSPALPTKLDTQLCSPFVSPAPSPTGTISAVNSCPVSPNSDFRSRMPNFDLKVMATYASKLLSTQHHHGNQHQHHHHHHHHQQQQSQLQQRILSPEENRLTNESHEVGEEEPDRSEGSSAPGDFAQPTNGSRVVGEGPSAGMVAGEEEEEEGEGREPGHGGPSTELVGSGGGGDEGGEKSNQKPPYSYAQLIVQALLAAKDHRQTLSNIYSFISEMYPYYKMGDKGWKNSIRHNLSLNQYFAKAPREKEGLGFGKGGYWCMHPDYEDKLTSQAYVKRKKKGIPVFPSSHLISSRSAPPSPTHHPTIDHPLASLKEMNNPATVETPRLTLPLPPTTSHFTLNTYFPTLPQAVNSSHSLPASPSRPPNAPAFPPGAVKFFPMPGILHGPPRAVDDMALVRSSQRKPTCETIPEGREESVEIMEGGSRRSFLGVRTRDTNAEEKGSSEQDVQQPPVKKQHLDENAEGGNGNSSIVKPLPIPLGAGQSIPATSLSSLGGLVSLPPATMQHPGAPPGLFIPISLTAAAAGLTSQQRPTLPPPQNMQLAPHPFLSGYFNCGTQPVPLQVPVTATNSTPANPSSE